MNYTLKNMSEMLVMLIFLCININSQTTVPLEKNIPLYNHVVNWPYFKEIKLNNNNYEFDGYLVVQINPNSKRESSSFDSTNSFLILIFIS